MKKSSQIIEHEPYTESAYYQIRLTARYTKMFVEQFFEKKSINISFDEFISLAIIEEYGSMCQRDLAKLMMRDRANVGRIAQNLESLKLIDIVNDTKNKRLVKNIVLTNNGKELLSKITHEMKPVINTMKEKFKNDEMGILINALKSYRETLTTFMDLKM